MVKFRRYCEDRENYKLINLNLLFEILIDVILNEHSPNSAKALEMKQIGLRCLANLALDKAGEKACMDHKSIPESAS